MSIVIIIGSITPYTKRLYNAYGQKSPESRLIKEIEKFQIYPRLYSSRLGFRS